MGSCEHGNTSTGSMKCSQFLDWLPASEEVMLHVGDFLPV